ncbi:hypothetical protein SAMN05216593_11546 [Pseudomonas asturiensis]|uniref:Uncharacterized protein n=1 Tax=Pseudomonas asturiensis TaxID=1190415 RepID=A0A1M7PY95_9PSED|nr:hypothetical protein SAMN05216593_11546 [Pseudomonas asturiensis]
MPCGRPHHVFDVALSRIKLSGSGPGGVPLAREKAIKSDEYSSTERQHSRTSPLPQNIVSSVGYTLFDKRRLAGDGVSSVTDRWLQKKYRRQAVFHIPRVCCKTAQPRKGCGISHCSLACSGRGRTDQNAGTTAPLYFSIRKALSSGLFSAATSFFMASESLLSGRATRMLA